MKRILIIMLKYRIKKAKKTQTKLILEGSSIIAAAYGSLIRSYEDSILFLNSELHRKA